MTLKPMSLFLPEEIVSDRKPLAEIENERRIGYAWYGTWPLKLLQTEYPEWKLKWEY